MINDGIKLNKFLISLQIAKPKNNNEFKSYHSQIA